MDEITVTDFSDIEATHKKVHNKYEYYKKPLVSKDEANQCQISVYEVPPGKAAYPYHFHILNEESFYIIEGTGKLITPGGEALVSQGDFLFFPAGETGAHKLTNTSDTEMLVYIDFDTKNPIDVAFYPKSRKVGIWGKNIDKVFKISDEVEYYEGE